MQLFTVCSCLLTLSQETVCIPYMLRLDHVAEYMCSYESRCSKFVRTKRLLCNQVHDADCFMEWR